MKKPLRVAAVVGIVLGGVLGMVGTMVSAQNLRALAWAIDGVSLIVATSILALFYFRKGCDGMAAGFLVYAIGEAVMLGGTAGTLEASVPSFAAGTALWSAALLVTSVPNVLVFWSRITGLVAAVLFAITSAKIFWGEQVLPISKPLPYFAYPFLVLTFAGWIYTFVKETA